MIKRLKFVIFLGLLISKGYAQTIAISVIMPPPHSQRLEDYVGQNANFQIISITNLTSNLQSIKLRAILIGNNGVSIFTKNEFTPAVPIELAPNQTRLLNAGDLAGFFGEHAIGFDGVDKNEIVRTRIIPEGSYSYCIEAYEYNQPGWMPQNLLSANAPAGCTELNIEYIEPPIIQTIGTVQCGETVTTEEIDAMGQFQNLMIAWYYPVGANPNTNYKVTIVEINPSNRDPNNAINSATAPVFYETTTNTNFILLDNTAPKLTKGQKYALRVQASNPAQTFRNRGYGEVCSFTYGMGNANNGGNALTLTQIYPVAGTTIPFQSFPVLIKWDPYNDNITHLRSEYSLRSGGAPVENNTRNLDWPRGPLQTQRRLIFAEMTQDQSQHIAINRLAENGLSVTDYRRGKNYEFNLNINCRVAGTANEPQGSLIGDFKTGMPVPNLLTPENGSTILAGNVEISFFTGTPPLHIVPPFAAVQAQRNNAPRFFNCRVNEKFLFELSRSQSFEEVNQIDTFTQSVGREFDLMTENESDIKHELYKEVRKSFNLRDTGWYYWRVTWLNDPRTADKRERYNTSEIYSFRIGGNAPMRRDSVRRTPLSCIADCLSELPEDRTAVSNLRIGQSVRFGKFNLIISRLSNASAPYNGEGTIQIPMLGCRVRVLFSNLQSNAAFQVFSGSATAVNDAPMAISEEMARQGATFAGLTDAQAQEINRLAGTAQRMVSIIRGLNPEIGLPLGLDNQINGVRHTIAIIGMHFSAERATLNAMASFDYPELNGWLSLAAGDICFHPSGINAGEGRLYNPQDKHLIFSPDVRLVFSATNIPARDSGTFVSWDCNGFKALHIKGEFRFSRNVFVPDSITGDAAAGIVKARFHAVVTGVNQWMLRLDMDPFQLTGLPEWGFVPQNIIFDFNSNVNFQNMQFPVGYANAGASFKGFYMQQLSVRLPKNFKTYSAPDRRLMFSANNMIIDRTGFSGNLLGRNIINVSDGNMDGWGFGIDSVYLEIVSNGFRRAGLNGDVIVPIAVRPIDYRMVLNRNALGQFGYECLIQPQDTLKATIINPAVLRLTPTSRIELTKRAGEDFRALAVLDGSISIEGRIEPIGPIEFRGMRFERLTIENRRPFVECHALSFASPDKKAGGFPVTLDSFRFVTATEPGPGEFNRSPGFRVGLSIGVKVQLLGERNTFGGSTRLNFMAVVRNNPNQPLLVEFSGISCQGVGVKGTIGPVSIDGGLNFYTNNATYGDGIRGYINAEFRPLVKVQAIVQFGVVNNRAYFYVDGSARIPRPGIPLIPGAINITGFGGAVYYGMRLENMPSANTIGNNAVPDISVIGNTSTGGTVIPDRNASFGFMARMYAIAPTGNAYKAMIELGASFNNSGGVSQMNLGGNLIIMSETNDPAQAKIGANMRMIFDFERAIFDGRFDVWVNLNEVIRGRQAGNRAGQIHMYADSSTWFIKIGKPNRDERIGLVINLLRQMEVNGYIMVGKGLEPIPALPEEITRLLRISPNSIRDPRVVDGDGFAFGAELRDGLPKTNFLIFYAQLQYILGFDVSILRTPGLTCDNLGGAERGVDGWYSEGQLYAYFIGEIGIHVDVWFVEGDFPIIKAQLAAAIMGGFPNPNWFKGNIGGEYSILGGLVKGHCEFEVAVGQRCVPPVQDALSGFELVTQLKPGNGETDVDVGISPAAVFNIAPGHQDTFSYLDGLERRQFKTFRIMYRNFTLTGGTNTITQSMYGAPISFATFEKSQDGRIIGFTPLEYLQANTTYNLRITAYIEYFENGRWIAARGNRGLMEKVYTSRFTTGEFPETIPESDILYTYPHRGQRFLLQNECRNGFIKTRRSVAQFFNRNYPVGTTTYHVEFLTVDGSAQPIRTTLNPRGITDQINFSIPSLDNSKTYAIRIIEKTILPNVGGGNAGRNKLEQNNNIVNAQVRRNHGASTIVINNAQLLASQRVNIETNLYVYYYRTSAYNTLASKLAVVNSITSRENSVFDEGDGMIRNYTINLFTPEPFDVYDAVGESFVPVGQIGQRNYTGGLIRFVHSPSASDNINRRDRIFNVYQTAVRTRVINSTYTIAPFVFNTPATRYALYDEYGLGFYNNSYRPKLQPNEYIPAPVQGLQLGGFGNQITPISQIIYTGYQDAHRAKTQLANCFALINSNPLFWGTYYQRSTAADRVLYQDVLTNRRFTGYPVCQTLNFRAEFVLPISCYRDADAGRTGSIYRFNTVYPPCLNGPR
ncbi:MAG: hypothetical protein ACKVQB_00635 [Bacteroidia bacterium]